MPTRILVIRAGQLGDTVYASSIIEPLRHHFGTDTVIDWVGKTGIARVYSEDARVSRIFEVKSRNTPLILNRDKLKIIRHAMLEPYDYIVNLELGKIFNSVMRLCRAKHKIGMPYRYFEEPKTTHAVDNLKLIYQSFLTREDLAFANPGLSGSPPEIVKSKFGLPNEYYVLVPANSHIHKTGKINHRAWPLQHWCKLFELLKQQSLRGVIIGGHAEAGLFTENCPLPENITDLAGKTGFAELVGLIEGARGVITTDTGPSHIASAVNTPVYALIGPTNHKRTGPYQTEQNVVRILSANIHCSPCYHTERLQQCQNNECMQLITPEEVMNAVRQDIQDIHPDQS